MHALTPFLAKLIGLYCALLGAGMLVNRKDSLAAIEAMMKSPQMLLISGVIALPAGLALVVGHNVWSGGVLPFVVTLVGWAVLIKAVVLIAVPQERLVRSYASLRYDRWFTPYMVAVTALGLILAIAGFTA